MLVDSAGGEAADNDHNGFSHQGPGLIDVMLSKRGTVARIYLPPDANCLLSMADHCFRSRNYVNLIVIDKQPQLQYLNMDDAIEHCRAGASIWHWAGNERDFEPDVIMASAGDIPTLETLAATDWLRHHVPDLKVRVVNVVDLMSLFPPEHHPHGMDATRFVDLFTADKPVVFAFHGYQRALHEIVHGRVNAERFHVRGFNEQGTTTTPFDMVVLNGMSRYDRPSKPSSEPAGSVLRPRGLLPRPARPCRRRFSTRATTSRTCPRSATGRGLTPLRVHSSRFSVPCSGRGFRG